MQETFIQYKGILLDAPFFTRPFSEEFRDLLTRSNVYAAATYESVVAVFRDGLVGKDQRIFLENLAVVSRCRIERLSHSQNHYSDIIGAALHLSELSEREGERYLLATSNQLLLQIIVLRKLKLDIYDITEDKFIRNEQFPAYSSQFAFKPQSGECVPTADLQDELVLYDERGQAVALVKDKCDQGSEAVLYRCVGSDGYIAKVLLPYNKDIGVIMTREKLSNIHRLLTTEGLAEYDWVKIPKQLLYKEPERQNVVGFMMERVMNRKLLDDHPALQEENESLRVFETLGLHIDLVRKLICLGIHGFYVHDFNSHNFVWTPQNPGKILMLDTDSFCSGNYYSKLQKPGFWTRKKQRNANPDELDKLLYIEECIELAYTFGAWLMMRRWNALKPNGMLRPEDHQEWYYFPPNVRTLIKGVLQDKLGHLPFFDAMIHELYQASIRPEWKDLTYEMVLNDWENDKDSWSRENPAPKREQRQTSAGGKAQPSQPRQTGSAARTEERRGEAHFGTRNAAAGRAGTALPVYDASFEKTNRMLIRQPPSPLAARRESAAEDQARNKYIVKFPDDSQTRESGANGGKKEKRRNRLIRAISIVLIVIVLCAGLLYLYHELLHDLRGCPLEQAGWTRTEHSSICSCHGHETRGGCESAGRYMC